MDEVEQSVTAVYEAANHDWKTMAERRISELVIKKVPFTSEDIIRYLEFRGLETPDMRALGGMFMSRSRANEIRQCGWTTATRKERHKSPIRIWRGV